MEEQKQHWVKLVNIICSPLRPMMKMKMQVFWEVRVCRWYIVVNTLQEHSVSIIRTTWPWRCSHCVSPKIMVALAKQMLHSSETYVSLADIAYHTTRPISSVLELLHVDRWTNWEINVYFWNLLFVNGQKISWATYMTQVLNIWLIWHFLNYILLTVLDGWVSWMWIVDDIKYRSCGRNRGICLELLT